MQYKWSEIEIQLKKFEKKKKYPFIFSFIPFGILIILVFFIEIPNQSIMAAASLAFLLNLFLMSKNYVVCPKCKNKLRGGFNSKVEQLIINRKCPDCNCRFI